MERNKDSLRDPWDNIKHTNITHYRGPRRRREKGPEKIFEEVIAENTPNMRKDIVNQVQETHSPTATKMEAIVQKVNQHEKAESYVPDEGTR